MLKKTGWLLSVGICLCLTACSTQTNTTEIAAKKDNAAQIHIRLAMAYLERHDIQRAKQKLLIALEESPSSPEPWYAMGYLLESTGNPDQAKKYYLKAIELAPGRGDTLNNYGTYLCRTGDYTGAIKQFLTAIKDPKYLDSAAAYENAGLCAMKIPNLTLAREYYSKALNEDPMRPTSLIELAEINYKSGDIKLARHELTQFLQVSAPNMQSYELENKIDAKMSANVSPDPKHPL